MQWLISTSPAATLEASGLPEPGQVRRLNHGGDRQANAALYRITISRPRWDQRTQDYLHKRISEGKSRREAIHCLKRYIAREVHHLSRLHTRSRPTVDIRRASTQRTPEQDLPPHRRGRELFRPHRHLRIIGAVLMEQTDERTEALRDMGLDILAKTRLRFIAGDPPNQNTDQQALTLLLTPAPDRPGRRWTAPP